METTAVKLDRGTFLWYELMTKDKAAAIDFYTSVIGWKTQEFDWDGQAENPYDMWTIGDVPIGGVMEIDPATMGEMPPHWRTFISVPDVDAAVTKAQSLGASVVVAPFDVPEVGRMAFLNDPQCALFSVYKPGGAGMEMRWPPKSLEFSWNELATTDYEAAFAFYNRLFGWERIDEMDMGDGYIYVMYGHGDRTYGGMYNKPPDQPGPPAWMFYVMVNDINGALDRLKKKGGHVLNGPMEVPGGDLVAQCVDPQGAAFALHQTKR